MKDGAQQYDHKQLSTILYHHHYVIESRIHTPYERAVDVLEERTQRIYC